MLLALALATLSSPQIDWDFEGSRSYLGEGALASRITDAETSPDGSVFVCVRRTITFTGSGPVEARVAKVDGQSGAMIWESRIEGNSSFLIPVDVVAQADGGVIAVATEVVLGAATTSTSIVARFDASGVLLWQTRLDRTPPGSGGYATVAHQATSDGQGGVLIAGYEAISGQLPQRATIFRVDSGGQELPPVAPFGNAQPEIYDVERCASGDILVALGAFTTGNRMARLDASFQLLWETALTPPIPGESVFLRSIVEDELGNVFGVISAETTSPRAELVRLDPATGAVLWAVPPYPDAHAPAGQTEGTAPRIVPRAGGGVWLAGRATTRVPSTFGTVIAGAYFASGFRPDGTGHEVWSDTFPGPGYLSIYGLAVDPAGRAYIHGETNIVGLGGPPSSTQSRGPLLRFDMAGEVGTPYCTPASPNSTGLEGQIRAAGRLAATDNDVVLQAAALPPLTTALFVSGSEQGVTPLLGGSQGVLCIAGTLGRFDGSFGTASHSGFFRYRLDTQAIPTALGPIAATAGLTYQFQCWHRDTAPGGSNTTNAVTLTFE